jgi:hypothetical protein
METLFTILLGIVGWVGGMWLLPSGKQIKDEIETRLQSKE